MPSITWKIEQIETIKNGDLDGVIVTVCFKVLAEDGAHQGLANGDVKLAPPDAASFAALSSVTEPQVVQWVKSALTADGVADFENRVSKQIDLAKAVRPAVTAMPWSAGE